MTTDPSAAPRPREVELRPTPRIQKLSSAIVWIAAVLAVAVLWIVGYLVTAKSLPRAERRGAVPSPLPAQAEDLADRIRRAAEREAEATAAEREAARSREASRRPLPPGFESLFAETPAFPAGGVDEEVADPYDWSGRPSGREAGTQPQETALDRARASELVPAAFRSTGLRPTDAPSQDLSIGAAPPSFADVREDLRRAVAANLPGFPASGLAAPGAASPGESPRAFVLSREARDAGLAPAPSPYTLRAGTLLPAVLTAGIHSDLPGQTTALVRRNVYDTRTGRHLLVPQGSRLVGEYDSRVAVGEKRVLVAWHFLMFPDGRPLDLRGMPGADLAGAAGLRDKVDNHFVRTFGGALLLAAISAGVQLSQPSDDGDFRSGPTPSQVAAAALGQELGRVATEVTRRAVDLRPTLEVRPGLPFHVEVTADLTFDGPYPEPVIAAR